MNLAASFYLAHGTTVQGYKNIEALGTSERIMVICNHVSRLDGAILAKGLPEGFVLGIDPQRHRIDKNLLPKSSLVIEFDSKDQSSVKKLVDVIEKEGKNLALFPEERMSDTGGLTDVMPTAAEVASLTGCHVVPVCIRGAEFSHHAETGGNLPCQRSPQISVHFGVPTRIKVSDSENAEKRQWIAKQLLRRLLVEAKFGAEQHKTLLFNRLVQAGQTYGWNRTIIEDPNRSLNYRQLVAAQFIIARKLMRKSKPKERIGVLLPSTTASCITLFSCLIAGCTPAMLNFSAGTRAILQATRLANINLVVTSKQFVEKADLQDIVKELEASGKEMLYLENVGQQVTLKDKLIGLSQAYFPQRSFSGWPGSIASPDETAVILFTSGSEGVPKGVALSHSNLVANVCQIASTTDLSCADKILNALPTFHAFGLTGGMLLPLCTGVPSWHYPSPLHYQTVVKRIQATKASIFFSTNTFLYRYGEMATPEDFATLRLVIGGAEKIQDRTRQLWLDKFGIPLLEGYGLTEASPGVALCTMQQRQKGSVGPLLPGIKARLESEEGISQGKRLFISGPNLMSGYLDADGGIKPLPNGWHDTGDMVNIDADSNFISIVGRVKRFAKVSGEMVSLMEIEEAVNHLWEGSTNAVVAVPDEKRGETVILVTDRNRHDRTKLVAALGKMGIAQLGHPKKVIHVDEVPLLGSGKPDYSRITQQIGAL